MKYQEKNNCILLHSLWFVLYIIVMVFVYINEDTQVSKLDKTTSYSSKSFLSQYTFQSKKKFTHIKSKTLIKLKISLANVKISIHNECFKTFSGNIAWWDLYALSSCNVEEQISINIVKS